MSTYTITSPDDAGCGVAITRTGPNGYRVSTVETGHTIRVALSDREALAVAGQALVDYKTDGLQSYVDPDTGERVDVDWSRTVTLGKRLMDGPEDYLDELTAALDDTSE